MKPEEKARQISINCLTELEDLLRKEQGFNHNTLGQYLLLFQPARAASIQQEDHHGK